MPVKQEIGNRYERLVVVAREENNRFGSSRWKCVCDCGGEIVTLGYSLRRGHTKSCGCMLRENPFNNREKVSAALFRHGHNNVNSPTYRTWHVMKQRCYNPRREQYLYYGGRGIKVCDRWRDSFENFLADMGIRPVGKTLDRKDVDGNYEPSNCRWATPKEQASNKRSRTS